MQPQALPPAQLTLPLRQCDVHSILPLANVCAAAGLITVVEDSALAAADFDVVRRALPAAGLCRWHPTNRRHNVTSVHRVGANVAALQKGKQTAERVMEQGAGGWPYGGGS